MSKVLVTGAGGFVGAALCRALLERGHQVRGVARGEYPELTSIGVETHRVDLSRDDGRLRDLCRDVAVVFHTAAKVEMWGRYEDFFNANVVGTRAVVTACRAQSVPALVFTSSPSVVANGRDLCGVDESQPYPTRYEAFYPETKAMAEHEVLAANCETLRTIALRPHLIFGPGDTNLVPTITARARAGRLMRIGAGNNLVDFSFIDDCVSAHLLAWEALGQNVAAAGRAYFISQGEPFRLWEFIDRVVSAAGLPRVRRAIPRVIAVALASVLEGVTQLLPGLPEPRITRFLASEMATHHYFNISAARELLQYQPAVSMDEGLERTFIHLARSK